MLFLICATVRELRAFRLLSGDNIGAGLGKLCWFGAVVSKSFTKEPMARSGRRQDRGITRFLISGVSLGSAFVSDLDILGVAAVCRRLRRASD